MPPIEHPQWVIDLLIEETIMQGRSWEDARRWDISTAMNWKESSQWHDARKDADCFGNYGRLEEWMNENGSPIEEDSDCPEV